MIDLDEDVTNVNTSCITDFQSLFVNKTNFNQGISNWNVDKAYELPLLNQQVDYSGGFPSF